MRRLAGYALLVALAGCTEQDVRSAGKSFASSAPVVASDGIIIAQIEGRFVTIDGDSALHVAIASHDGKVKLNGRVRSATTAQRFTDAARHVAGVKAVATSLTVDGALPSTRKGVADFVLAAAVRASLTGQAGVNGIGIGIAARGGVVTLRGRVKNAALHATLLDAAKHTSGVTSVVDDLKVDS